MQQEIVELYIIAEGEGIDERLWWILGGREGGKAPLL